MSMMLRLPILVFVISLTSICALGQDLGSSNKLFGGSKKKAEPQKTVKKTPPKTKASKPVSKRAVKKPSPSAAAKKVTAKKAAPSTDKKQAAAKKPSPPASKAAKTSDRTAEKKSAAGEYDPGRFSGGANDAKKGGESTKVDIAPSQPKLPPGLTAAQADDLFEDLIDQGNHSRDDRNYSAAEAAYSRAKAIKPRDSRAVYGLGNLFSDQLRWQEAERAYRAALEIEPNDAVAHIALSYVLTQPVTAPNLSDRYAEAEKLARRAIQLAPRNALAFDQLGASLELRGFISSETENAYRRAIQIDPGFAPPYAHLGRLLRRRGQKSESAAAYQKAIDLSTDVGSRILVAEVLQSEQRFADSEPLLRDAIAEDPRNPTALLLLGRALTTMGSYPEAESVLRRALSISGNGFVANSQLAILYLRQNKPELAENALLQASRFVSDFDRRLLARQFEITGDAYMKAGNALNAERAYKQAISFDNESEVLAGKIVRSRQGRFGRGN